MNTANSRNCIESCRCQVARSNACHDIRTSVGIVRVNAECLAKMQSVWPVHHHLYIQTEVFEQRRQLLEMNKENTQQLSHKKQELNHIPALAF